MVTFSPYLFIKVTFFNLKEEYLVRKSFYHNPLFKKTDLFLKKAYRFSNPYHIAKKFAKKRGEADLHTYGETPLTTLYKILKLAKANKEDIFLDLGAGRGRVTFFVSTYLGCKAIGIEHNPHFLKKAQKIASSLPIKPLFLGKNMLLEDSMPKATLIYFYGICLDEPSFLSVVNQFALLSKGVKVITVSFPLSDYIDSFRLISAEIFSYPWGEATVYIQEKT